MIQEDFVKFIFYSKAERKAEGSGRYANNLSMIKIYVKAETFKSRSVAPGQLRRFVMHFPAIGADRSQS